MEQDGRPSPCILLSPKSALSWRLDSWLNLIRHLILLTVRILPCVRNTHSHTHTHTHSRSPRRAKKGQSLQGECESAALQEKGPQNSRGVGGGFMRIVTMTRQTLAGLQFPVAACDSWRWWLDERNRWKSPKAHCTRGLQHCSGTFCVLKWV
jgi:hypothetical protein